MVSFNVIFQDGLVAVTIDDNGYAVLTIDQIRDDGVVFRAINRAVRSGARRATMFTGDVANPSLARKNLARAEHGTTWLGGVVTRLEDGDEGPRFRIDWETLPFITE